MSQAKAGEITKKKVRRFELRFDFWLVSVLGFFAVLTVAYLLGVPDVKLLGVFTDKYMDLVLLSLALISIQTAKSARAVGRERLFWHLIIAAFLCWFVLRLTSFRFEDILSRQVSDVAYFLFYFFSLLAIESCSGPPGKSTYSRLRYWLTFASNMMFSLGVLGYFVILPALFDPRDYDTWLPSFYCYLTLDIYLAFRFFVTAYTIRTDRRRAVLCLLGLSALGWAIADGLELWLFKSNRVILTGNPFDLLWALPYLPAILATRIQDLGPCPKTREPTDNLRRRGMYDRLFLVTAFVLPMVHLGGYGLNLFSSNSRFERGIFIMSWFVLMSVLLVIQYSLLYKRNRMLESLRRRNVRILEAISKIQSHYIAASDSPSVFENMLEQLLLITDSEYGFVGEMLHSAESKGYLNTLAMAYISGADENRRFFGQRGGPEIHDLDTLFGAAVSTGTPVISNDPATYPRRGGFPSGSPEPHAFLGIPLYHREKLIGMFAIANRNKGYDSQLLKYLEPFSSTCAGIISAYHSERERSRMSELASRFGRILDESQQEIYIFDADSLHFMQVNRGARENIGYSLEELRELTPEDLYPDTGERFRNILQPLLDGEQSRVQYTTTHLRKDGTTYPVDVYLQRAAFDKRPVMVAVALDITERKRMEKEKARLESQIIQSQKLETIGTLAGGIAHDFNNILAPIIWYTEMIVNDEDNDEEIREDLKHVLKAANRAKDLVQQILTFGRLGEIERSPVQVQLVMEEAIKLLRASLPATIEIERYVDGKCEPVLADPTQIHQVVMNLCTNAYHAMRQGGGVLKLTLGMKYFSDADTENHPDLKPGMYVELRVSDTGHGMDPTTMDRIFEPFFTTKRVGEGTGLGLSVIHGIVMTHGGAIHVESKPGAGTTFSVYLPPIDYEVDMDATGEKSLEMGSEHILFVDDEDEIACTGKLMLERFGYRVTAYVDSMEALSQFRADPYAFDLVITDQTMPQITGLRLAREIRRIRTDLPIILATGFSEEASEDRWKEAGVDLFVMKPIVGRELHRLVRSLLESKKGQP